jgi:hypothetical protein
MSSARTVSRLQGELDRLKIRHGVEIVDMRKSHADAMATLTDDHRTEDNARRAEHADEMGGAKIVMREIQAAAELDVRAANRRTWIVGVAGIIATALLVWVLVR